MLTRGSLASVEERRRGEEAVGRLAGGLGRLLLGLAHAKGRGNGWAGLRKRGDEEEKRWA
jgi:hypothetical protein